MNEPERSDATAANPPRRNPRPLAWAGLVIGVSALAGLSLRAGLSDISAALAAAGPALFLLVGFHVFQLGPHTLAWWLVFPRDERPRLATLAPALWAGQSANLLLPVANLGGELVKLRLALLAGAEHAAALASVIADKTSQAAGAVLLMGVAVALLTVQSAPSGLIIATGLAMLGLGIGVAMFIRLQRSSGASRMLGRLGRGRGGALGRLQASAQDVEIRLAELYRNPRGLAGAVLARVAAAILLSLEVWAASHLMGLELSLLDALTLRVASRAVRSAAFFVWGGFGVQEGTFAALGALYGIPPASLIALSLATRVREVLVAVPGLGWWLFCESRTPRGARDIA